MINDNIQLTKVPINVAQSTGANKTHGALLTAAGTLDCAHDHGGGRLERTFARRQRMGTAALRNVTARVYGDELPMRKLCYTSCTCTEKCLYACTRELEGCIIA